MKAIKYSIIASFLFIFSACEKVIQPDLESVEPQLVIEGVITNQGIPCTVKISKSSNFSQESSFNGVEGAIVVISDEFGNTETLTAISPGIYQTITTIGIEGRTYQLKVVSEGKEYTSTCKMPIPVALDTLGQVSQIVHDNVRRFIIPYYTDPSAQQNFYRFKVYDNADPIDKIFVRNDHFTNGLIVSEPLGPFLVDLIPGDTANVYMMCIEKTVYDYFFSLEQTLSSNSAAPSNPISNISGGCQGYFSAHTVSHQAIVIQE